MFGRSRRAPGDTADQADAGRSDGRRFGGAPAVLSLLLVLGAAGGLAWLHATDQLAPRLAGGPGIEVEIPSAIPVTGSEPAESAQAEVELATAPPGDAAPGDAAPGEAGLPEAGLPEAERAEAELPDTEQPETGVAEAEPAPAESEPGGTAAAGDGAQDSAVAPEAAPADAAPDEPADAEPALDAPSPEAPAAAADAPAGPEPEPSAMPEDEESASVAETTEPPPPAPPVPQLEADLEGAGQEENSLEVHGGAGDGAAARATQVAGATVPPGVVPAWQRFARPFPGNETRPRIAVVVAGLGLSEAATTAAIQQLPGEITLSFSPYSNRLEEWVAMAQAAGHEVMIDLPMEPASFPRDDPGPQALLTSLSDGTNAERLAWILGRAEGYVGVASYMGSRFTTSSGQLRPVLETLAREGLLFLDSRAAADSIAAKLAGEIGLTHAINDRFLDNEASRVAIDGRLQQIERIARTRGVAVAMGYAYPVTIERLTRWTGTLTGKGLALAPITAVANLQEDR